MNKINKSPISEKCYEFCGYCGGGIYPVDVVWVPDRFCNKCRVMYVKIVATKIMEEN